MIMPGCLLLGMSNSMCVTISIAINNIIIIIMVFVLFEDVLQPTEENVVVQRKVYTFTAWPT